MVSLVVAPCSNFSPFEIYSLTEHFLLFMKMQKYTVRTELLLPGKPLKIDSTNPPNYQILDKPMPAHEQITVLWPISDTNYPNVREIHASPRAEGCFLAIF